MSIEIPKEIGSNELLVRYIFKKNFKGKKISKGLDLRNVFIPYKGGVSLQRAFFCDYNDCKKRAKEVPFDYVGFMTFKKSTFDDVKLNYIQNSRLDFEAKIVSTPMKEDFTYREQEIQLFTNTLGNPAHADLIYENPAVLEGETPKTAQRSFSRKLAKNCQLLIDNHPTKEFYDNDSATIVTFNN